MAVYQIISSNIISGSFDGTFSGDGSSLNGVVASASPGGSNTNVQFNDSGTTSGSTDFTFDKTTGHVTAIGFSGSFSGDGSGLSGVTSTLPSGILSSSAQIESEISGAFTSTSASLSSRITTNTANIQSLTSVTASYVLNAQTSSMSVSTASYVEYTNVANKPTLISSSAQIESEISGAFTEASAGFSDGITNNSNNIQNIQNNYVKTNSTASMSVATASYVEYTNVANKPTIISSSAQIASEISGAFTETSGGFSTRITTLEGAGGGGGSTFPYTGSAIISGSLEIIGPTQNLINGTTLIEVSSDSDLPSTLQSNTTYLIRGNVYTGRTLNVTNSGTSIIGIGRNQSHLTYTGSNELFNVHNQSFSIKSLTMKSSGSIMVAQNVTPGAAYNDGRTKVLDIKDCQVKNTNNVMSVSGFELVDINNSLFWYITGSQGLQFKSVRHLELSSCELYNWYDELNTGSFAPSGTRMIEIQPNTGSVNTPVVNINSCIVHPEQGQIGLYIDPNSETLFGTVAANTFIDVNGGVLLGGSTYDSSSMLKYDVGINQGLEDSVAYLYGYQNGTDAQAATTTYTQISIANFSTDIETRMSASLTGITYIGTKPIDVIFQVNAGVTDVGGNNEQFDLALYKNTSLINGSERRIELDSGEEGNVNLFALTNIVQNDLLTVYYKSPTNDNFTLQNFSIMIKE